MNGNTFYRVQFHTMDDKKVEDDKGSQLVKALDTVFENTLIFSTSIYQTAMTFAPSFTPVIRLVSYCFPDATLKRARQVL